LGGFDAKTGEPSLYWIDHLSAMAKLKYASHGYANYFCLSTMDRYYHDNMTLDEAKALMKKCLQELETRFIINFPKFEFHVVDKEGARKVEL
jgi:20S proteasome subunit beta 4